MDISWDKLLPNEYCNRAMKPLIFERHTEPSVNEGKMIGFDEHGTKCFYFHSFLMTAEGNFEGVGCCDFSLNESSRSNFLVEFK